MLRRPSILYVEVPTANDRLVACNGKKIYCLKLCTKTWNPNPNNKQVYVRRYGFPIVPDFGDTAHAYCGDELKTVIGDFMHWNHIPNLTSRSVRTSSEVVFDVSTTY